MRSSEAVLAAMLAAGAPACSTQLAGGDLAERTTAEDSGAVLPVASGCMPFHNVAGVDAVTGAVRSLALPGGGTLFVVDDATASGVDVPSLAITAPAGASIDDCLTGTRVMGPTPTPALDPPTLAPLSAVEASGSAFLYFVDVTGTIGVAAQDPADGRFRPTATPLWTSDRPVYGSAAVSVGDHVHVLGCRGARFLDADCFVARAPVARVADESAYEYYVGGGRFSPRVADAWPTTTGASSMDIAPLSSGRWVMVYVTPLENTIFVRSGLSPEGPWSTPVPIATCDLADSDMFCAGIHVHPSIASAFGTVVVTYAAATLSPGASARRSSEPAKWWPRMAALALPPMP